MRASNIFCNQSRYDESSPLHHAYHVCKKDLTHGGAHKCKQCGLLWGQVRVRSKKHSKQEQA